jgi:DNA repair exonuclease SbcCD ATPase subunit
MSRSADAVKRLSQERTKIEQLEKKLTNEELNFSSLLEQSGFDNIDILLKKFDIETVSELQKKMKFLSKTLTALKEDIASNESLIANEQDHISELESRQTIMKQTEAEMVELKNMDAHAKYVRKRLVNGFVTDYIFQKRLLGIIRGATNPYVKSFTNGQYTGVDLEPTQAKGQSSAGLILKIWDERDQAWKKTAQLSYGDRTAISLGLRMGISRTMSSIRSLKDSPVVTPRVRSVLLDEPLGGLDRARREAVVRNLVNDQSFEQILLITHTDVQGWEGIPVIDVSKTGAASNAILEM